MKTAISLPDDLFDEADVVASRLGVSRSQLYATALTEYLAKLRSDATTQRLDIVYGDQHVTDVAVREAARRTLNRSEW